MAESCGNGQGDKVHTKRERDEVVEEIDEGMEERGLVEYPLGMAVGEQDGLSKTATGAVR